jgi:hypothetical protein
MTDNEYEEALIDMQNSISSMIVNFTRLFNHQEEKLNMHDTQLNTLLDCINDILKDMNEMKEKLQEEG